MTTLYPGAEWRPLAAEQQSKMAAHDLIILHTMVGSLWGTDSYFADSGYSGTESHFGVGYDGEVLQWVDLECRADANLDANDNAISIETADMGEGFPEWGGSDVPAWTDAQIEAIAQIVAWCCARWDIPCELVPDSKSGRRGVGYHRQGIDNWRVSGGEEWSTSTGKVCPGDRRVGQVPDVIDRAAAILAGGTGGGDWFDMADVDDLKDAVRAVLNEGTAYGQKNWAGTCQSQLAVPQSIVNQLNATQAALLAAGAESEQEIIDSITAVINDAVAAVNDNELPAGISAEELAFAIVVVMGRALFGKGRRPPRHGRSRMSAFCAINHHDLCTKEGCICSCHPANSQSANPSVDADAA